MIKIEAKQLDNGWYLSVFNSESGTKDVPDTYCQDMVTLLKEIETRVKTVSKTKGLLD